jgi:hypothetical protein
MFRIDVHEADDRATMQIAGRLDGQFAEEVRRQVLQCKDPHRLVVDLSEATFVDESGEEVLSWLGCVGAQFTVQGCYWLEVCERLHLPILNRTESGPRSREAVAVVREASADEVRPSKLRRTRKSTARPRHTATVSSGRSCSRVNCTDATDSAAYPPSTRAALPSTSPPEPGSALMNPLPATAAIEGLPRLGRPLCAPRAPKA